MMLLHEVDEAEDAAADRHRQTTSTHLSQAYLEHGGPPRHGNRPGLSRACVDGRKNGFTRLPVSLPSLPSKLA